MRRHEQIFVPQIDDKDLMSVYDGSGINYVIFLFVWNKLYRNIGLTGVLNERDN